MIQGVYVIYNSWLWGVLHLPDSEVRGNLLMVNTKAFINSKLPVTEEEGV